MEAGSPDAWKKYPVFYFDFNGENYHEPDALEMVLEEHLQEWEEQYGILKSVGTLGERFRSLLKTASASCGSRCVVLVDEYDKPLKDCPEYEEYSNAVFKGFFSSLKRMDEVIQFVMITGITKFQKVSIFSDLNQLRDISLSKEFAGICGITEHEMVGCFGDEIRLLAEEQGMTEEQCLAQLKKTYDGYRFHPNGEVLYNPFSLLNVFADKEFSSFWFETGTPSFLVRKMIQDRFDVRKLTDGTLYASEASLSDFSTDSNDPLPLLYQTGYLTIKDYDKTRRRYTLGVPNEEVEYGLLKCLIPK